MSKVTKSKSLIPKTAKDCKVSEELAEDVIDFYYSSLRKEMESLQVHRIRVPILGTFVVSRPKLIRSIERLTKILSEGKPEDFDKIQQYNLTGELKKRQEELLNKINTDYDEREQRRNSVGEQKKDS